MDAPQDARRRARRRLQLFSAVVLVGLLLPMPELPGLRWLLNLLHVPAFALWVWLACEALQPARAPLRAGLARAAALGLALALGSELLQGLIPGRWMDWRDLVANLLGLALGLGLWRLHRADEQRE